MASTSQPSDAARPRVMVFVPAYRCAEQISRVIAQLEKPAAQGLLSAVIIVDNQSRDGTLEAARSSLSKLAGECAKRIFLNRDNYGLGGSHKVAFRHAQETNADHLIVLHGDDQADFADVLPAMESGVAYQPDCFLGSRFANGATRHGYSLVRTYGNVVYNFLFSMVAGRAITDLGSGLNVYRVASLDLAAIRRFPDDLTFNYVMLLWSIHRGHDVRFFPLSWRETDQRSNVKLVQQGVRVLDLLRRRALGADLFFETDHRQVAREAYSSDIVFEA